MADLGWNPLVCFIGSGKNGEKINHILQHRWRNLLRFYSDYKIQNPEHFYDISTTPTLDFLMLSPKMDRSIIASISKYHFVFMAIDDDNAPFLTNSIGNKNQPHVSIFLTANSSRQKRFFKNETIAVIPTEEFHYKAADIVIALMQFCMFPRFVSFDFADFRTIQRKVIKILFFKTSCVDYREEFRDFYKANIKSADSINPLIAIFFFRNCDTIKNYHEALVGLNISIYSDHCAAPINYTVKALIIQIKASPCDRQIKHTKKVTFE